MARRFMGVMGSCATLLVLWGSSAAIAGQAQQTDAKAKVSESAGKSGTVRRIVALKGVLKDRNKRPMAGVTGVRFALYKDQEGGAPLWTEIQNLELDEQGRYSVLVGATQGEGVPIELFTSGESRWLGVQAQISGEEEKARVLLVSVPYALKAADADTLGGKPASAYLLSPTENDGSGKGTST